MKPNALALILFLIASCTGPYQKKQNESSKAMNQIDLTNEQIRNYQFLQDMYQDSYFPKHLVDQGKAILIDLCHQIEQQKPKSIEGLYALTHSATEKFNELEEEFMENDSELETAARETIAMDFAFIANAYGYSADVEELIAPRNW